MPPLALSDDAMAAILDAAKPIPPDRRGAFLKAVAAALDGREIGDGIVGRAIRERGAISIQRCAGCWLFGPVA